MENLIRWLKLIWKISIYWLKGKLCRHRYYTDVASDIECGEIRMSKWYTGIIENQYIWKKCIGCNKIIKFRMR